MQSKGGFARRPEHPYRIKSLADLSDGLRRLAEQVQPYAETINSIYVIPEQMLSRDWSGLGGIHRVPEQALLFTPHGVIHVQAGETMAEIGHAQYLPGDRLLYARLIIVLIYGRIELVGVIDDNLTRIIVEYNSVSQELLQPELYKFLRLAWNQVDAEKSTDNQTAFLLNQLEQQSDKFGSGLRNYSLQKDEQLQGYVFQPRPHKQKYRISHQPIAPASLLALTDKQLLIIEEGITSATSYGYFFTYCPNANVVNVETKTDDEIKTKNGLQDVCIHLRKDNVTEDHQLTLKNEHALAFEALWASHADSAS